jgi:hypothetical protein
MIKFCYEIYLYLCFELFILTVLFSTDKVGGFMLILYEILMTD